MSLQEEIAAIIATHHDPSKRALPQVTKALRGAPLALRQDWAALRALYEDHLSKEEVLLFPAIEALERGDEAAVHHILGPIAQMHVEHGQLGAVEQRLRSQLDAAPGDAVGEGRAALLAFLDDLQAHAGREDEGLFKQALALAMQIPVEEVDLDELVGGMGGPMPAPVAEAPPRPPPQPQPPRAGKRSLLKRVVRRVLRG